MITVNFFTTLRIFLNQTQITVQVSPLKVFDLLHQCEAQLSKPFLHKLLDTDGQIIPGTMILLNGHNILHLNGLETIVKGGDVVALFPPGGGG
jgi:sulfur-carrier protein